MRAILFLRIALFVTTAWPGGYKYFIDIVVNALAYEIDGVKDESDRTVGFRCAPGDWDDNAQKCKPTWQKWPLAGFRASINEILIHPIALPSSSTNLVRDSSNNPVAAGIVHNGKTPTRRAYELSKSGTNDWAKHAEDVGKLIQEVGKDNWSWHRPLFEKVKDFNKALGWSPATRDIANPRNPSTPRKVIDFKKTIEDRAVATSQSKEDMAKEVSKAAKSIYSKSGKSNEHKVIIDANRRALERRNHCRA